MFKSNILYIIHSQGYTPAAMFRVAEEFFISLNMSSMPQSFWANSVVEELPGQPIICQPSAWDFCNRQDYRLILIFANIMLGFHVFYP